MSPIPAQDVINGAQQAQSDRNLAAKVEGVAKYIIGAVTGSGPPQKTRIPGQTGEEAAKDIPSWAKGERPLTTENGKQFAKRLCDEKYGAGNYDTGAGSEYGKIKKFGDRAFR